MPDETAPDPSQPSPAKTVLYKSLPYCGICGLVYPETPDLAAKCCTCVTCGLPMPGNGRAGGWRSEHPECAKRSRAEGEARTMAKAEKLESWDGPIWLDDSGGFHQDLAAYVERLHEDLDPGDPWPEFVYVCRPEPFPKLDLGDVLDNLMTDWAPEDFDRGDVESSVGAEVMANLANAVDAFNQAAAANVSPSYYVDVSRAVRMPPRPAMGD